MKLSLTQIRKLTTKDEAEFLEGLAPGRIERVTPARLRQKLGRARRARDKYTDLARRQGGQVRGKVEPTGARRAASNQNTLRKVQLFDWAIQQIEARLKVSGEPAIDDEGKPARKSSAAPVPKVHAVEEQIASALEEDEVLTFGDLWARMPDVPVHLIRKALWKLSESGAVELAADDGIRLASEEELAEIEEVEVDIAGARSAAPPGPPRRVPPQKGAAGKTGRGARKKGKRGGGPGNLPNVRIHSHVRSSGRRSQSRRDRR